MRRGFPLALRRAEPARNRWFDDYARQSVERDALELSWVHQRQVLRTLLDRLARQTCQVLDVTAAAAGLDVERKNRRPVRLRPRDLVSPGPLPHDAPRASGFRLDRPVVCPGSVWISWCHCGLRCDWARFASLKGLHMTDVLVLLGTLAVFAVLLGLLKGVERL